VASEESYLILKDNKYLSRGKFDISNKNVILINPYHFISAAPLPLIQMDKP